MLLHPLILLCDLSDLTVKPCINVNLRLLLFESDQRVTHTHTHTHAVTGSWFNHRLIQHIPSRWVLCFHAVTWSLLSHRTSCVSLLMVLINQADWNTSMQHNHIQTGEYWMQWKHCSVNQCDSFVHILFILFTVPKGSKLMFSGVTF